MPNNPVVHFEIYVHDMARARAFYEAVFQTRLQPMANPTPETPMEMWAFPMDGETGMTRYGSGGMLVRMDGSAPGVGGTMVYFGCEDCAVEAARAAAHGGSVVQPKTGIGEHGWCAVVRDSEGNLIGLHSMA